ncbi:MAG TPA: hypothetical protein VGZ90_16765 [Puia sp.]|jgi:hypothetical protein|nr:hypothetical protein [Puia sp.]
MKKQIKNSDELEKAIAELELKASAQKRDVEETFTVVTENLKPLNIVRNGVRSVFSPEHREDLVNALIGLGTGFISRKLLLGRAKGILGKTAGKAVEWGIAGLVSNNAEKIKEKAGALIDKIFKKKTGSNHTSDAIRKKITS